MARAARTGDGSHLRRALPVQHDAACRLDGRVTRHSKEEGASLKGGNPTNPTVGSDEQAPDTGASCCERDPGSAAQCQVEPVLQSQYRVRSHQATVINHKLRVTRV